MAQIKISTQVVIKKPIGDNPKSTGNIVTIEYNDESNKTIIECMEASPSGQGSADSNIKLVSESGNKITIEDTRDSILLQCTGQVNEISPKKGKVEITPIRKRTLP